MVLPLILLRTKNFIHRPVENHFRRKKSPRRNTALGSWQTREKLRRTDWSVRRIWTDGSGEQRGLLGLCQSAVTAASSLVNVDYHLLSFITLEIVQ